MKNVAFAFLLGLASLQLLAQGSPPTYPAPPTYPPQQEYIAPPPPVYPAAEPRPVRFLAGLGITGGGDTLATVQYTDGTSQSITAGGLVYIKVGVDWQVNQAFGLQVNLGNHRDGAYARNGRTTFERDFVEGLAYWQYLPKHRIGLGLHQTSGARIRSSGVASTTIGNFDYSSNLGTVLEYEWLFAKAGPVGFGLEVRLVSEKYTDKTPGSATLGKTYDGSHLGVGVNFYF